MSDHAVELLYLYSGFFTSAAGLLMMITYSLTNPWWRTQVGRMLITYAVAETGMSFIFAMIIGFHINPTVFRYVWVGLQFTVGCTLWFQTGVIIQLYLSRRRNRK